MLLFSLSLETRFHFVVVQRRILKPRTLRHSKLRMRRSGCVVVAAVVVDGVVVGVVDEVAVDVVTFVVEVVVTSCCR